MRPNYLRWNNGLAVLASVGLLASTQAQAQLSPDKPTLLAYEAASRVVYVDRCERDRCAELDIQTLRFEANPRFNQFVVQALVSMAWSSATKNAPYQDVAQLAEYFQETAKPGEQLNLGSSVLRQTPELVVLSLTQYRFEGGAHGESSQFLINWLPRQDRVISLETALLPGAMTAYVEALSQAHEAWLHDQANAGTIDDVAVFKEQWPLLPSKNIALMPDGLMVSYPRYSIGPGSFGEPTITLPYAKLEDVFKPDILALAVAPFIAN